jgi:hypothetical protein
MYSTLRPAAWMLFKTVARPPVLHPFVAVGDRHFLAGVEARFGRSILSCNGGIDFGSGSDVGNNNFYWDATWYGHFKKDTGGRADAPECLILQRKVEIA